MSKKEIITNDFTHIEYDPQYILQVNALKKYFPIKSGIVSKTVGYVKAVDGVTFNLKRGTTMGLVGESGCGKTTTGRTILRLSGEKTGGQVLFNGKEVYDLDNKEMHDLRTKSNSLRLIASSYSGVPSRQNTLITPSKSRNR